MTYIFILPKIIEILSFNQNSTYKKKKKKKEWGAENSMTLHAGDLAVADTVFSQ